MNKIKNLSIQIFDLDGTLKNTLHLWDEINRSHLESHGISYNPIEFKQKICGKNFTEACKEIQNYIPHLSIDEVVNEILAIAFEKYNAFSDYKPFAKEYLTFLKEKGSILCLSTANTKLLVDACLKEDLDLFDEIVTADTFNNPDKKGQYKYLFEKYEKMGYKNSDMVVYEDSQGGFLCAKEYFENVVLVKDLNNIYDKDLNPTLTIENYKDFIM